MQTKPSIVFVHGIWADGSSLSCNASWRSVWGPPIYEVDSSHVPMLSQPSFVIDVIRTAADAVSSASTRTA
jgi:hypothetical protein